jgi:hypothetical protein
LNLESEVLLKILDDHDQERQLDAERLLGVSGACDKVGADLNKEKNEFQWSCVNGNRYAERYWRLDVKRMRAILTLVPIISSTLLWISWSVMRLMCPLRTFLSQISSGLELQGWVSCCELQLFMLMDQAVDALFKRATAYPMLYKIDKNPDWNVFLNMSQEANLTDECGGQQKITIHKNLRPALHDYAKLAKFFTAAPRSRCSRLTR